MADMMTHTRTARQLAKFKEMFGLVWLAKE